MQNACPANSEEAAVGAPVQKGSEIDGLGFGARERAEGAEERILGTLGDSEVK